MLQNTATRVALTLSIAMVLAACGIALPACSSGSSNSSSQTTSKTVTLQPVLIKSGSSGSSGQEAQHGEPAAEAGDNQNGEPPSKPDGNSNAEAPVKPDGNSNAEAPAKPAGDQGNEPPAKPDGADNPSGRSGQSNSNASTAKFENVLGSWSMGGTDAASVDGNDYAYNAALYVTKDGVDKAKSALSLIAKGAYDSNKATGITVSDTASGDNGVLIVGTKYEIKDAVIDLITKANGTDTCDFSGKGSAIAVFGSDSNVTVENTKIHTAGVATMPLFVDDGATVTLHECSLQSDGGTLSSAYMNTPKQTLMVAPPWILGIMGTSRCANLMGTNSTSNFIDCETSAGAWAVLSVDAGSNMAQNIFNTTLTLANADESKLSFQENGGQIAQTLDNPYTTSYGTGYGTYAIGNVAEVFAGSTVNVGTYATIFTGGSALYTALEKGTSYNIVNWNGDTTATYTAQEDKVTVINSDTFGFMAHQSANDITIEKGTQIHSGYATFLVKSGSSNETLTARVDDARITNGGVLIQVMDNDDATNGGMMDSNDPANTNGDTQNFKPTHSEAAGFFGGTASVDSSVQQFTFTNGEYNGNVYNASGSDGLNATRLDLSLGSGAVLNGAAASTSAVHVTFDGSAQVKANGGAAFDSATAAADFATRYQNTQFGIAQYYDMGQVANMVHNNGGNAVNITLSENAIWNVTATSLISSLSVKDKAKVIVPEGITLTVGDKVYTNCTLTAKDM